MEFCNLKLNQTQQMNTIQYMYICVLARPFSLFIAPPPVSYVTLLSKKVRLTDLKIGGMFSQRNLQPRQPKTLNSIIGFKRNQI